MWRRGNTLRFCYAFRGRAGDPDGIPAMVRNGQRRQNTAGFGTEEQGRGASPAWQLLF